MANTQDEAAALRRLALARGKGAVEELSEQVQAALKLLESEEADAIIEQAAEEYRVLIEGTQALMTLQWAMAKSHGMEETARALRSGAQGMAMALTLIHYAYALGLRRGREEAGG